MISQKKLREEWKNSNSNLSYSEFKASQKQFQREEIVLKARRELFKLKNEAANTKNVRKSRQSTFEERLKRLLSLKKNRDSKPYVPATFKGGNCIEFGKGQSFKALFEDGEKPDPNYERKSYTTLEEFALEAYNKMFPKKKIDWANVQEANNDTH